MDSSNNCFGGSERLTALAQHLCLYKPPPNFDDGIEEQRAEESGGKVVSQVGFVESATPIARQPEKFRPKRAAVLICLFEGDDGDLRVILTKRSSKLTTHSVFAANYQGKWVKLHCREGKRRREMQMMQRRQLGKQRRK